MNVRLISNEKEEGGIKEFKDEGKIDFEKLVDLVDDVKLVS